MSYKDFKTCVKRNYKMAPLQRVIDTLRIPVIIPDTENAI